MRCARVDGRRHRRGAARAASASARTVVGVGARRAGGAVGAVGRAGVQLVHPADLAHRAELGIVDLGDAAVGQERVVVQRLLG